MSEVVLNIFRISILSLNSISLSLRDGLIKTEILFKGPLNPNQETSEFYIEY